MSSVGRFVFVNFISDAGVAGAPGVVEVDDPSSDRPFCGDRELPFRGGGGAIRTSGSGSGDTDSFDEASLLDWNPVCSRPRHWDALCRAVVGVRGCFESAFASSGVTAKGAGNFFLCAFILGDSRTTRAGLRDVVDFRRPVLPRLLIFGESTGSIGDVDWEWVRIICGLGI